LLFFTDGVVDAENDRDEYFSLPRLTHALAASDSHDIQGLVDHCLRDLRQFQRSQEAADDVLILGVKRRT